MLSDVSMSLVLGPKTAPRVSFREKKLERSSDKRRSLLIGADHTTQNRLNLIVVLRVHKNVQCCIGSTGYIMDSFAVSCTPSMHMFAKRSIGITSHHIENVAVCPLKSPKRVYQIKVPNLQEQVQYHVPRARNSIRTSTGEPNRGDGSAHLSFCPRRILFSRERPLS